MVLWKKKKFVKIITISLYANFGMQSSVDQEFQVSGYVTFCLYSYGSEIQDLQCFFGNDVVHLKDGLQDFFSCNLKQMSKIIQWDERSMLNLNQFSIYLLFWLPWNNDLLCTAKAMMMNASAWCWVWSGLCWLTDMN